MLVRTELKHLRSLFYRLPLVRRLVQRLRNIEREISALRARQIILERQIAIAQSISPTEHGTEIQCRLNNVDMIVPVELLKIYPDTLVNPTPDGQPSTYLIENEQCDWLCSKLVPGDTAFDIGASYGCITLPMAFKVGIHGQVHAFEPAFTARKSLQRIVELNNCQNVSIVSAALSDKVGTEEFVEYTTDNELSWASDMSRPTAGMIQEQLNHKIYQVGVTTMDRYVFSLGLAPKAVKIDVEGWEFYVLLGAKETLIKFKPNLCIDTHVDVKTNKPCLETIVPFLKNLGYQIQTVDRSSDKTGRWQILFAF